MRLRARTLLSRTGWDPWRAVHRLKEKATRLRERKRGTLTLRDVFRRAPDRKPIQHPEMQELFGHDGILRVRPICHILIRWITRIRVLPVQ